MEVYKDRFESADSYADILLSDVRSSLDISHLFEKYTRYLLDNSSFENNFLQVFKMAELVADPGIKSKKSIDNFLIGEVLGYAVMHRAKGDEVYGHIYEALNGLYSHSRKTVNEKILENPVMVADDYRQRMIGLYINHVLDYDLSFDSIPPDEMVLATRILSEITNSEDQLYDATRGYSLVRASLVWHARHQIERKKDMLRSLDDEYDDIEEFYHILSDVEVDPHLSDGKVSVQKTVNKINNLFEDILEELIGDLENFDDSLDEIKEELISIIAPKICKTEELTLTDKIYIDGVNIAMLCNVDGDIIQMIPLGAGVGMKGYLLDYDVNAIPTEEWLESMHQSMGRKEKKKQGIPFNSFGLLMMIGEAEIVDNKSGKSYSIDDSVFVYVPTKYNSTKVYKIMIPEEEDDGYYSPFEVEDEDD